MSFITFIWSLANSKVIRVVPLGTGGERRPIMFCESIISTSWCCGQRNLPPSTRCMNETWMIFASCFVTIPGYHESLYATATYWSTLITCNGARVPSLRQKVVIVEEAVVVLASMQSRPVTEIWWIRWMFFIILVSSRMSWNSVDTCLTSSSV